MFSPHFFFIPKNLLNVINKYEGDLEIYACLVALDFT